MIGAASGGPLDFVSEKNGYLVPESEDKTIFTADLAESSKFFVIFFFFF